MSSTAKLLAFSLIPFSLTPASSSFFKARKSNTPARRPRMKTYASNTTNSENVTSYETGKIKANIRVFLDQLFVPGQTLTLAPSELRHLRARRARDGDTLLLFNNSGYTATAVLRKSDAIVLQVSKTQSERSSITAIIGIPKSPSRTDLIVEKLTELGVTSIAFACTSRSTKQPAQAKIQRWHRLAVSAAKQSLRTEIPRISVLPFDHVLEEVERHPAPLLFCSGGMSMLSEECTANVKSSSSALLLIGPEGGFDDAEIDTLVASGATKIGLGNLRLRVETAAVVAAGVISQLLIHRNSLSEKESL